MLRSGGRLEEELMGRGKSRCKRPEMGPGLGSPRSSKEAAAREL